MIVLEKGWGELTRYYRKNNLNGAMELFKKLDLMNAVMILCPSIWASNLNTQMKQKQFSFQTLILIIWFRPQNQDNVTFACYL